MVEGDWSWGFDCLVHQLTCLLSIGFIYSRIYPVNVVVAVKLSLRGDVYLFSYKLSTYVGTGGTKFCLCYPEQG